MGEEISIQILPVIDFKDSNSVISHINAGPDLRVVDTIPVALKELFEIERPEYKDQYSDEKFEEFLSSKNILPKEYGNWVWYPWLHTIVKVPPVDDLRLIRTARNQHLITKKEQQILFNKTILVAGMSVGSNVLEMLVQGGIGGTYIVADMDVLEITNLNRIKSGLSSVGMHKVSIACRKALELDPYITCIPLYEGVNTDILKQLFTKQHVDMIIDEVDDISAKVALRLFAQEHKIPLTMATDNSDGAIVDIERYDIDNNQVLFNGRIPDEILTKMISGELTREESGAAIGKFFVGLDLVDNNLLYSLSQVRKSIPSWPQLGIAASMSGLLAAYVTKVILLGGTLVSNRYIADFDKTMNNYFATDEYLKQREDLLKAMGRS